jgi:hypothetical protein
MICETCKGTRVIQQIYRIDVVDGEATRTYMQEVPCPTCGGCGIDYCCDPPAPEVPATTTE